MTDRPRHAELDEDDVRVRAGRGSRPRTRRRPEHAEAVSAFVVAVDRGRYRCVLDEDADGGTEGPADLVTAMKARDLGRGNIVVGDTVALAGNVSGASGSLARVVRVEPRRTVLRRSADDTDPVEPLLCLTKSDLAGPDEILPVYAPLGVRSIVLGRPLRKPALARLHDLLTDRLSVVIGSSGVGKSTLVNTLIPDADRAVGEVSAATGRGRHVSSSVVALALPGGQPRERHGERHGWVIDTPGLRSFGLGHLSADRVVQAFPDLAAGTAGCPRGCDHLQPDCALDEWAASHGATARLDSLRRLLRSREGRS